MNISRPTTRNKQNHLIAKGKAPEQLPSSKRGKSVAEAIQSDDDM
jgi:hypothetical protein